MTDQAAQFRSFNRYYTSVIGLLNNQYLNSEFSLTEVRILYELNDAAEGLTASELVQRLKLDKGYLSRLLAKFEEKAMIKKDKSKIDARSGYIRLTEKGESVFKPLDLASQQQAESVLKAMSKRDAEKLLKSMDEIKIILEKLSPLVYDQY